MPKFVERFTKKYKKEKMIRKNISKISVLLRKNCFSAYFSMQKTNL